MSKNLKKYLFISVLYLPALGLVGCSGARQLGHLKQEELSKGQIVGGESAVSNNPSIANISVDIAGHIGEGVGGVLGGAVGGGVGAMGGVVYAVCSSGSIVKSIEDASSKGAYYGSAILAPIGKHAGRITTSAAIWGTSYVFNGLGWVAANVCNRITSYVVSPIWNACVTCAQPAADLNCSLDQVPDWQIVNVHGEHEQGIELKDLAQLNKCPLGLPISSGWAPYLL